MKRYRRRKNGDDGDSWLLRLGSFLAANLATIIATVIGTVIAVGAVDNSLDMDQITKNLKDFLDIDGEDEDALKELAEAFSDQPKPEPQEAIYSYYACLN